jgi:hypothetical protein
MIPGAEPEFAGEPFDQSGPGVKQEVVDRLGGKASPVEVNLRESESPDMICQGCEYYEMPGQPVSSCVKVAGEVQAQQLCDIFEPASGGQGVPTDVQPPEGVIPDELLQLLQ